MKTPNEFWLCLHNLADAYDAEGLTPRERAENILDQFRAMPPIAQRQILADLLQVARYVPDLYPLAVAVAKETEQSRLQVGRAG